MVETRKRKGTAAKESMSAEKEAVDSKKVCGEHQQEPQSFEEPFDNGGFFSNKDNDLSKQPFDNGGFGSSTEGDDSFGNDGFPDASRSPFGNEGFDDDYDDVGVFFAPLSPFGNSGFDDDYAIA